MPSPGNTISSDYRGPAVNITIWSFLVISGLAVGTKVWSKLSRTNGPTVKSFLRLQLDDYILIASFIFAAAFSITLSQQVIVGLGSPIEKIKNSQLETYQKLAYTAQLFYICATCLTNSAGNLFGLMLEPSKTARVILIVNLLITGLWFLTFSFAVAFQCSFPHPWAIYTTKCVDQTALWICFEAIDMLVNLSLAATLCSILQALQMSRMKHLLVAFFASRALIFIPIGFQFARLGSIRSSPHWALTPEVANGAMISAAILNTNIVITCLPFLKKTMEYMMPGWSTSSTQTGFMRGGFGYSSMGSRSKSNQSEKP